MIANILAYGIARHYRPTPIYEALLEQDGVPLHDRKLADALAGVSLREVPIDGTPHTTFAPATSLGELVQVLAGRGREEVFPVVDGQKLVGVITLEDLIGLASEQHLEGIANAADVMRPPIAVRQDEDLRVVFETMLAQGVRELPAVDEEDRILGFVDETSIAHAYMAARAKAR